MNKRTGFIAGIIFVALAALVFFALRSFRCPPPRPDGATSSDSVASPSDVQTSSVSESIISSENTSDAALVSSDASDEGSDHSFDISFFRFTVEKIISSQSGEEMSPRVVLGSSYNESYLSFDDSSHLALCLSSGSVREGSYEIYGSVISVTYSDGKGAEYEIITDDSGSLLNIVVPYGEYSVFFAK